MSIITPSRVDLFSPAHHNPTAVNFGPLQPSAMPQPPPSVSPHPSKGFTIPSNIDSRYREHEREAQNDPVDVWRKSIVARALPVNEQPSRGALGRIDVNAASKSSRPSASASTNIAKNAGKTLSSRPATTRTDSNSIIPKLAPEPDVFGPSVSIASTSRTVSTLKANPLFQAANNSIQSGKRGRNDAPLGPVQLFRDNTLATEDSHGAKRVKHEKGPANVGTGTGDVKRDRETFRMEEENWRAKWIKLFPGLVFHFEVGAEQGSAGRAMMNRVLKMGAKVDQFFSTKVTHLIVKNHASPQKAKSMAPPPRRKDSVRESPKNPFLDGTGVTDLAKKAEAMNMKVWTTEKLSSMLSRLAPVTNGNANNSLHTLLEDEKIHGTRERDLTAPRPDYFYFKPGSKYLLIEDATGRHRTVMWKEYGFGNKEDGVWPTLHEQFLRPPTSANCNVPLGNLRERAWTLYVEGKAYKGENPPCSIDAGTSTLKRSTSLRAIPGTPTLPQVEELPYQNASGNSVNLTSNIASTSTANHSPAMLGQMGFMGTYKDRAITQMNRRVQVLKGNARLAASKRTSGGQELDLSGLPNNRRTTAPPPAPAPSVASSSTAMPMRTFLTQDQLVKMLEQARAPVAENENVTAEMRRRNRERVWAGLKGRDQDTAAGYCENCRVRYTDLSVHIASRKHRRFACDEENFQSLDKLLAMLRRPGHPDLITSDFPPCPHRHAKTHSCGLCDYWQSEKASSLHSPPSDQMDAETNLLSSPFKREESGSGSEQCSQETQPHDY